MESAGTSVYCVIPLLQGSQSAVGTLQKFWVDEIAEHDSSQLCLI